MNKQACLDKLKVIQLLLEEYEQFNVTICEAPVGCYKLRVSTDTDYYCEQWFSHEAVEFLHPGFLFAWAHAIVLAMERVTYMNFARTGNLSHLYWPLLNQIIIDHDPYRVVSGAPSEINIEANVKDRRDEQTRTT